MENLITEQELREIKESKGEVRGVALKTTSEFIVKEEGEKGLTRLQEAMEKIGFPIEYKKIKSMDFYPISLWGLYLLVIKRLFNYSEEKMQELGANNAKASLIVKLFMKYFFSVERLIKEVPTMWDKYYTVGKLSIHEYSLEKNYAIVKLENFRFHHVLFEDLKGYFASLVQMVTGRKSSCRLTKSIDKGDEYYEFEIKW